MHLKGLVVVPETAAPHATQMGGDAVQIANRPIVCHVVDALAAVGVRAVAVVAPAASIPALRDSLDAGLECSLDELSYLSPAGDIADLRAALIAAEEFVGEDACLAHPVDGLVGQDLDPFVEALAVGASDLMLLLHRTAEKHEWLDPTVRRLLGIDEMDRTRSRLGLTGVCLFGPGALRSTSRQLEAGPHRRDLATIAWSCANRSGAVEAALVRSWRRYAGSPNDLLELNRIALDRLAARSDGIDPGDNRIEGRVDIHPTAEVSASTVVGPAIIGRDARISHSYIGPYTSVGAGAEIENSEVVRSIVSEGTRIMNIGGRIEASTIGRGATIFRDFALPRSIRLHVGEGVELALT